MGCRKLIRDYGFFLRQDHSLPLQRGASSIADQYANSENVRLNAIRSIYYVYSDFVSSASDDDQETCFDMWWDEICHEFWSICEVDRRPPVPLSEQAQLIEQAELWLKVDYQDLATDRQSLSQEKQEILNALDNCRKPLESSWNILHWTYANEGSSTPFSTLFCKSCPSTICIVRSMLCMASATLNILEERAYCSSI